MSTHLGKAACFGVWGMLHTDWIYKDNSVHVVLVLVIICVLNKRNVHNYLIVKGTISVQKLKNKICCFIADVKFPRTWLLFLQTPLDPTIESIIL